MKHSTALTALLLKQNTFLLLICCCFAFAKNSKGQAAFTAAWPLTSSQAFTTSGAGAPNITAVNQVMSATLFIPASNQYIGTTSGTAGDGQRSSPKLNDGNDGGWINDGGGVEGRYMEFAVNPNAGFGMTVTNISFSMGNRSRSEIRGNAYYYVAATNAGFTMVSGTALGTGLGAGSTNQWKDYSFTTNISVPNGSKIFVRFYPYNTGSNTTGKYFCARNVSVSGTTTFPAITNVMFTNPASCITTQTTISWTGPSNFNPGTQTVLAFLKPTSAVTAGTPTNALATYTAATNLTGTAYQNDAAARCIYKGTGTDVFGGHSGLTITGLTANTTYHLLIYVVTGTNTYSAGVVGNGTTLKASATPSAGIGANPLRTLQTTSTLPITWTAPGGTLDGVLVQASTNAALLTPPGVTNGVDPGVQTDISGGTATAKTAAAATGYNSFTGYAPGTMYYFRVNPYISSGSCITYHMTSRTIQAATLPNTVTNPSLGIDGTTGIGTITWTPSVGYNANNTTLVFIKNGSAVNTNAASSNPAKNPTTYTANAAFGSGSAYTFDAIAFCVYNGNGNTCTVTGLSAGVTYHVLILTSVTLGNTNVGAPAGIQTGITYSTSAYATTSAVAGGTYTWNGSSTDWQLSTSWTPARSTAVNTDNLIFDGAITATATPTNFPASQTIASLTVTNNAAVTFSGAMPLTITNNNGLLNSDLVINSGSSLDLSGVMNVVLSASTLAAIGGSLNINTGSTYNTSASGAISTVTGILKNAGTLVTASINIVVAANGTYNHALNGGTIPTAVWNTGSICKISGITSATSFNGHSQIFSRFVWDCNQNAGVNFVLGVNTSALEATDSFIVYRTGAGRLQLTSSSGQKDYSVGNYAQFSGTVSITEATGAGGQRSLGVNNSFYASDSLGDCKFFILNDPVNAGAFGRLFVAGNLVMRKISVNTVSLEKVGLSSNSAELWFNGGANQYAQFSTIGGNIDFITAQSLAGFSVTLGSDATANKFLLTQGTFNIASNTLTINNAVTYPTPGTGTIGGSSTSNLIMGLAGNAGTLNFATGSRVLKDFTQNAGNTVTLGTELAITAGVSPGRDSLGLNAVLNTNDNLILRSDNDGTARLAKVQVNGSGVAQATINGKVTVERYLPMTNSSTSRRWRILTAPFNAANAPTINAAWQEGVSNPDRNNPSLFNPKPGYGTHITKSTTWAADGYDQGSTNNSSIYYFNAGTWIVPANTNSVKITDNTGCYMIFVRGDRSILVSSAGVAAVPTTLEPKGELNLGRVTLPTAAAGSSQTVGNPYASQIKLDNVKFNDTPGISKTVYLWDPKTLGASNVGKFITCSGNGSSYIYTGNTSAYDTKPGVIESSGAFMVKSNGGVIEFNESDKTSESTTIGMASRPVAQPAPSGSISTFYTDLVSVKNGEPSLADGVAVSFNKNYTNSIDHLDAAKLSAFNTKEDLGMRREGQMLAIERRKDVSGEDTVFLNISKLYTAAYQFKFRPVDFDSSYTAYLEDRYTNTITPIDLTTVSSVNFSITADSASFETNRFDIIFKREKQEEPTVVTPVTVFPNPVQSGRINLQTKDLPEGRYAVRLLNYAGQTIYTGKLIHQAGTPTELINVGSAAAKGIYKLQLTATDNKLTLANIIVQ